MVMVVIMAALPPVIGIEFRESQTHHNHDHELDCGWIVGTLRRNQFDTRCVLMVNVSSYIGSL